MVPSVRQKGEKHVAGTYVVQRKYEPKYPRCNELVISCGRSPPLRDPPRDSVMTGIESKPVLILLA